MVCHGQPVQGLGAWALAAACVAAPPLLANPFDDPFGPAIAGRAGCPEPAGPALTADEARLAAHGRTERGASCFLSGRCRLANAYLCDREIFPRAVRLLNQDERFAGASVWLLVQWRWITVYGCVRSRRQGQDLEAALRQIDDVEAVVPHWMVGVHGRPPYPTRHLKDTP